MTLANQKAIEAWKTAAAAAMAEAIAAGRWDPTTAAAKAEVQAARQLRRA
jgi:hypothetical protein